VVAIVDELNLPIRLIGVGEGEADLQDFNASAFVEALLPTADPPA
jgi:fused signal recognition particle receptor